MASAAGPAPWNHEDYWNFREGYRRLNKGLERRLGVEHGLGGYRVVAEGRGSQPKTKKVTLYNGQEVEVPDADYEDFIGFNKIEDDERGAQEIANYIEAAFPGGRASEEVQGAWHIARLAYAPRRNLMWVDFDTGRHTASVVYFRVPKEVYSELRSYALSGNVQVDTATGKERHLLGIKFWDFVRIRGTLHGSRYRFKYVVENQPYGERLSRNEERAGLAESRETAEQDLAETMERARRVGQQQEAEIDLSEADIMARARHIKLHRPGVPWKEARLAAIEQLKRERR